MGWAHGESVLDYSTHPAFKQHYWDGYYAGQRYSAAVAEWFRAGDAGEDRGDYPLRPNVSSTEALQNAWEYGFEAGEDSVDLDC